MLGKDIPYLVENRMAYEHKATGTAYLLLLFAGTLGAHRLYLGKIVTGLMLPALIIWGIVWSVMINPALGLPMVTLGSLWLLADLVRLPALVRKTNDKRRAQITRELQKVTVLQPVMNSDATHH